MSHRRFWLGLWLAASPLAAQLPQLSTYHPGTLHLQLAPGLTSQMGFDVEALNGVICGVYDEESRAGGGAKAIGGVNPPGETCRLVISNDGGPNGLLRAAPSVAISAAAQGLAVTPCGPGLVTVQPTGLHLKGTQPLDLACGPFSFEAELATAPAGPPSVLSLLPAVSGSATGLFTGALALRLDITYRYAGAQVELAPALYEETRDLVLDVAGRWTVAQDGSGSGSALGPGDTNLVLFVDRETVAESVWLKKASCAPARRGCTRLCLEASDAAVAALNGLTLF